MNDRRSGANPYEDLSRRTSAGRSRNGLVIGGVAVALVAVLAVVAIVLTGGEDGGETIDAVQEQAGVEATGTALPPYPKVQGFIAPAEEDPAVGETPPTLTGENFAGEPSSIDPGDGRAKVVMFLAHWCPHCQKEVPMVQGWVDDGNLPEDVDLYAVVTGTREDQNNYPPSKWLSREGWSEGILLDDPDQSAASAWGLTGYPYIVFIDADGRVVRRASGELPEADLDALVRQLAG